jgi:hypothetical protein
MAGSCLQYRPIANSPIEPRLPDYPFKPSFDSVVSGDQEYGYRIVVWINYPYRVVYIRFIGIHRQYDAIDAQSI